MHQWVWARDIVAAIAVGVGLFFLLTKVLKAKKQLTLWISAILGVASLVSFLSPDLAFNMAPTVFRLPMLAASAGIAVVFYFGLMLVIILLLDLIWWLATRKRSVTGPDKRGLDAQAGQIIGSATDDSPDSDGHDTGTQVITADVSDADQDTDSPSTDHDQPTHPTAELAPDIGDDTPALKPPRRARLHTVRLLTALALVLSLIITGYGFVKAQEPAVTQVNLTFPTLPSNFDGMTIALVADLHIGSMTRDSFLPMVVDQVNAAHPDLIVLAGDIADGYVKDLGPKLAPLKNLSAPYGVVVTTGNHEFFSNAGEWMDYYSSLGLRVLENNAILLQRGDQTVQILGINDRQGKGEWAPNLSLAVQRGGAPANTFTVLVAHEPVQAEDDRGQAAKVGVSLVLSGHTHGGQLWPLGYLELLAQPALSSVHEIDGVTSFTSRGVGTFRPPVRVGADPEIPIITLHSG
ncbi:MAG: metallophosphoesterase [Propionibacteriaceae bacterium]|nr:metallophosphoesterase [Propionibacteriaceae bacterium]